MPFVCYQDGKRCSEYHIKGWEIDTFLSKRSAEVFCFYWAYPVDKATAEVSAPEMQIGVPMDMSMSEQHVMMEIREE